MCHERWLRREQDAYARRDERLWDLFHRETEQPAPAVPIAEREPAVEHEHEEAVTASGDRRA